MIVGFVRKDSQKLKYQGAGKKAKQKKQHKRQNGKMFHKLDEDIATTNGPDTVSLLRRTMKEQISIKCVK